MQGLDPPALRVAGMQDSELIDTVVVRAIDAAREMLFRDAVTVPIWSVETAPAVAAKAAEVDPTGTDTDAGAISATLLLESVTVPPVVRGSESVTVQMLEALGTRVAGEQLSDVTDRGAVGPGAPPEPTTSVTDTPELVGTLASVNVIVSVYVPGAKPVGLTETVTVAPSPPLAGETLSHVELFFAVHARPGLPVLLIVTDWLTGGGTPADALKLRPDGETV